MPHTVGPRRKTIKTSRAGSSHQPIAPGGIWEGMIERSSGFIEFIGLLGFVGLKKTDAGLQYLFSLVIGYSLLLFSAIQHLLSAIISLFHSMLDVGRSMFDVRNERVRGFEDSRVRVKGINQIVLWSCSSFDVGCWAFDVRCSLT